jgi:hypothetical protein
LHELGPVLAATMLAGRVGSAMAAYRVLARQHFNLEAETHPFTAAGNTHFSALWWAPTAGARRGHVLVCDATVWSAAFKGLGIGGGGFFFIALLIEHPRPRQMQFGDSARGVAVAGTAVPDAELERLTAAGMRGLRYVMLPGRPMAWETMPVMAPRIAQFGWNINLQLPGEELAEREPMLASLACDVVIDHIGRFTAPVVGGIEPA